MEWIGFAVLLLFGGYLFVAGVLMLLTRQLGTGLGPIGLVATLVGGWVVYSAFKFAPFTVVLRHT